MITLEHDLAEGVLEHGTPPCLSLYQPTSRHHPDNQQDPIRFGNLVKALQDSLEQQYPRDETAALLAPFRALAADDDFWQHTFEGLAVLGARDHFHVYRLQRTVAPLAIVADSFHTKPLLRIRQSADRFHILGLNRKTVCLYEGHRDAVGAIDLADGVPETLVDALGAELTEPHLTVASYGSPRGAQSPSVGVGVGGSHSAMHHGHGGRASEVDIDTERFFRAVDRAVLQHHSQPSGLPLILAALPEHHRLFRELSHNPHLLADGIDVHPEALDSLDELRDRAWQVLAPRYEERLTALVEAFGTARAHKMGDDVLAQVARAAAAGRVKTLLIEAQRQVPGRLDLQTGRVDLSGDLGDAHTDDLLDDLGELVSSLGGDVVVVPKDRMPSTTGVAAIYRFGPTRPETKSMAPTPESAVGASSHGAFSPKADGKDARIAEQLTQQQTLEDHTVVELYDMARDLAVHGRSRMRKADLIAAIRSTRS